jgi:class 3 adenylate cyclase
MLFKYNGMLDKFVGDQIMAVFGHISDERDGARSAVRAAMEMQKATATLMKARKQNDKPVFQVGIGINTGNAILASVGSCNRQDYTVIGDMVNTTARLEKHARGGEVVIGERTRKHLPKQMDLYERKELRMRNRSTPIGCYVQRPIKNKAQKIPTPTQSSPALVPATVT